MHTHAFIENHLWLSCLTSFNGVNELAKYLESKVLQFEQLQHFYSTIAEQQMILELKTFLVKCCSLLLCYSGCMIIYDLTGFVGRSLLVAISF